MRALPGYGVADVHPTDRAPRHQAPTCPPQPGLLPESPSQSCRDPGPPGPCKVTLGLSLPSDTHLPTASFLCLWLGVRLGTLLSLGVLPAPPTSLWPPGHVLATPHPTQTCLRSPPAAPWASRGLSEATGAGDQVWAHTAAPDTVPSSPWSTRQGPDRSLEQGQCGHCPGGTDCRSSAGGRAPLRGPGRGAPRAELSGGPVVSAAGPLDSGTALAEAQAGHVLQFPFN